MIIIGQLQRKHALRRRMLRENQTHAGLVAARAAIGRVVHLETEVRPGRDEFGMLPGQLSGELPGA
jgi:hypothetical protein